MATDEDTLNEASETLTVTLTASNLPSGVSLGTATATGTITDDDALQAAVESMTQNVPEGSPAKFTVTLTGGTSTADVVVAYSVTGTATAGTDYTAPGGRLTLAPRATSGTITIATRTDDILDPGETLIVTLDSATTSGAATVDSAVATATITQAGSVTRSVADAAAEEGAAVSFTVTLSGGAASAVKVSYQTASGTEATAADAASDYTVGTGTLTFNPSASLKQTISVATTEDTLHEADETFTLTLTGVDLAAAVELGDRTATGTIEDDDDEPTLALTSVTQSLAEGGGSMTFTVSMDAATGKTATVDYTTVNGTSRVAAAPCETQRQAGQHRAPDPAGRRRGSPSTTPAGLALGYVLRLCPERVTAARPHAVHLPPPARMNVEEIAGLQAAEADSSRVRLVAQGSYEAQLGDGSMLVPMVQTGVRYDIGHAEEGFGAEVGGGARFYHPQWGLTVTAHGRFLLVHEASGSGEWGLRASALLNPTRSP